MNNPTENEIKSSEKRTLILFRDFCEENGLKYYLTFGTLLGAVRHGGFIPWDDDIDVFLPRKAYNYLLENFNNWEKAKTERREVVSKKLNPQFYCTFAKIIDKNIKVIEMGQTLEIGMWIDVFPMDELPDDKWFLKKLWLCSKFMACTKIKLRKGRKWYKNLLALVLCLFGLFRGVIERWQQKLMDSAMNADIGDNYVLLYRDFGEIGVPILPKNMFDPPTVLVFEGDSFSTPKEYDKFLRYCYGDYKVLPPVEERKSHHGYSCV